MIDVEKAITSLASEKVDYVIVGGVAITLHSSGYITRDMNFCYSRERANLSRLVAALAPFHPMPRNGPAGLPFIFDESSLRSGTDINWRYRYAGRLKELGITRMLCKDPSLTKYTVPMLWALNLDALIASKPPRIVRKIIWFCLSYWR